MKSLVKPFTRSALGKGVKTASKYVSPTDVIFVGSSLMSSARERKRSLRYERQNTVLTGIEYIPDANIRANLRKSLLK